MGILTLSMLADAFHYAIKLEFKQKQKSCFPTKPTGGSSIKNSPANSEKLRQPSQLCFPKPKGVIITIHHGMICYNAMLERFFWKNYRHMTCPINPW